MDDDLVLLTSYFNLVDGRRQDEADTFRVDTDLPSSGSSEGGAALYIVTEASTTGHIGPRARRLAADTIAWEYGSHADEPPPARLKSALRSAHAEVQREFEGHVAVGVTVMAVERDTVYLAQVAPSQVYVLHDGGLHSVPAAAEGATPFDGALGTRGTPTIKVSRDQVEAGDVICLCSTWYDRSAESSDLRHCFGAGTSDEIAECLLDLAQQNDVRDATAIVIEAAHASELAVVPTGDEPPTFMEQVDIAVQALANVGRMLWSELQAVPTNGHTREGVEAPQEAARAGRGSSSITSEVPLVATEAAPVSEPTVSPPDTSPPPASNGRTAEQEIPQAPAEPEPSREPPPADVSVEPTIRERRSREDVTEEVPVVPPRTQQTGSTPVPKPEQSGSIPVPRPQAPTPEPAPVEEPPSPEPERPAPRVEGERGARREEASAARKDEETSPLSEIEQVNSRLQHDTDMADVIPPVQAFEEASTEPARIYATSKDIQAVNRRPRRFGGTSSIPVIRPGLGDIDLRQPVARPTPPAVIWASLALLLAAAAIAFGLYVRKHLSTHPTPPYASYVAKDIAKATKAQTPAQQDYYLSQAKKNINLAQSAGVSAKKVATMRATLLATSDSLHHITRETAPTLLADFGKFPGAQPSEIAAASGLVYVVDPKRKGLFSVATSPGANPTEVVQAGDTYSGFTVGIPQHVVTDGNIALMLDDKNVLVRDANGTKTATSLTQQNQTPGHYVAMAASDPDVYLLDTANSQVWRYPYAVTGYNPNQAAYWDANPPKLGDGKSLAFDKTDLYILKGDGTVLKFDFQANPQKFTINLKRPISQPSAFYTDAGQQWVWIADPAHKRVVQLDKTGGYSHTYLSSSSGMNLGQIGSISVSPDGKTIYILVGSKLYDFPVAS